MADYFVTVNNPDRAALFRSVFGTATVKVTDFQPEPAIVPEHEKPQPVYLLDLGSLTTPQRQRLEQHMAERFGLPVEQVRAELPNGVPILAADCSVTILNPHFLAC